MKAWQCFCSLGYSDILLATSTQKLRSNLVHTFMNQLLRPGSLYCASFKMRMKKFEWSPQDSYPQLPSRTLVRTIQYIWLFLVDLQFDSVWKSIPAQEAILSHLSKCYSSSQCYLKYLLQFLNVQGKSMHHNNLNRQIFATIGNSSRSCSKKKQTIIMRSIFYQFSLLRTKFPPFSLTCWKRIWTWEKHWNLVILNF